MHSWADQNRRAWDAASKKYVEEASELLRDAGASRSLRESERQLLAPVLASAPVVVHGQSGNGMDALDLAAAGAAFVIGVDFSAVAAGAATRLAAHVHDAVTFVVADVSRVPLADGCADLFYTGKGALMWLPDITEWAVEAARLLRPGGHLFIYEQHPVAPLWSRDEDEVRVTNADYFGGIRVNDTFPASAIRRYAGETAPEAVEQQWPLAAIVGAVLGAGLTIRHLGEYPDPFWKPAGASAAAWQGRLPHSFSLMAQKVGSPGA